MDMQGVSSCVSHRSAFSNHLFKVVVLLGTLCIDLHNNIQNNQLISVPGLHSDVFGVVNLEPMAESACLALIWEDFHQLLPFWPGKLNHSECSWPHLPGRMDHQVCLTFRTRAPFRQIFDIYHPLHQGTLLVAQKFFDLIKLIIFIKWMFLLFFYLLLIL